MVLCVCNPSIPEAGEEEPWIQGWSGLRRKTLCQRKGGENGGGGRRGGGEEKKPQLHFSFLLTKALTRTHVGGTLGSCVIDLVMYRNIAHKASSQHAVWNTGSHL